MFSYLPIYLSIQAFFCLPIYHRIHLSIYSFTDLKFSGPFISHYNVHVFWSKRFLHHYYIIYMHFGQRDSYIITILYTCILVKEILTSLLYYIHVFWSKRFLYHYYIIYTCILVKEILTSLLYYIHVFWSKRFLHHYYIIYMYFGQRDSYIITILYTCILVKEILTSLLYYIHVFSPEAVMKTQKCINTEQKHFFLGDNRRAALSATSVDKYFQTSLAATFCACDIHILKIQYCCFMKYLYTLLSHIRSNIL